MHDVVHAASRQRAESTTTIKKATRILTTGLPLAGAEEAAGGMVETTGMDGRRLETGAAAARASAPHFPQNGPPTGAPHLLQNFAIVDACWLAGSDSKAAAPPTRPLRIVI